MVSHGLIQVAQLCSTVAWLEKGVIQEIGPSYEVIGKYAGQTVKVGADELLVMREEDIMAVVQK